VWLDPPREVLEERLAHRTGHYMNPCLLDSQLETLEAPQGTLRLAGGEITESTVAEVLAWIEA
jgi:gluconokinase